MKERIRFSKGMEPWLIRHKHMELYTWNIYVDITDNIIRRIPIERLRAIVWFQFNKSFNEATVQYEDAWKLL